MLTVERANPFGAEVGGGRKKAPLMSLVRRHPLISFFVLAYALSWWPWPLYAAGIAPVPFFPTGVLLAALIVIALGQGRSGLRELGSRLIRWRVAWIWYAAALCIPLAVAVATLAVNVLLGAPAPSLAKLSSFSIFPVVLLLRLINPVNGPVAEEPGWRGFALPRLQWGRSPLVATLILAVLVAGWHLPYAVAGPFPPIGILVGAFGVQFWYAWIFNRTEGSVLLALLMHSAEGTFGPLVIRGLFDGADFRRAFWIYVIATCVTAICLVVLDRKAWQPPAAAAATSPPMPTGEAPAGITRVR